MLESLNKSYLTNAARFKLEKFPLIKEIFLRFPKETQINK